MKRRPRRMLALTIFTYASTRKGQFGESCTLAWNRSGPVWKAPHRHAHVALQRDTHPESLTAGDHKNSGRSRRAQGSALKMGSVSFLFFSSYVGISTLVVTMLGVWRVSCVFLDLAETLAHAAQGPDPADLNVGELKRAKIIESCRSVV